MYKLLGYHGGCGETAAGCLVCSYGLGELESLPPVSIIKAGVDINMAN